MRLLVVTVLAVLVAASPCSRVSARGPLAVQPNLGTMTVSPARAGPGQLVTISGRTRGLVQFLPPFVQLRSAKTTTVHMPPGPCGGAQKMPLAFKTVVRGGGSGGKGTRQNPPVGTTWTVRFRVPRQMSGLDAHGSRFHEQTPSGKYFIDALGVGIDFCTLPARSTRMVSVGTMTVLSPPPAPLRLAAQGPVRS